MTATLKTSVSYFVFALAVGVAALSMGCASRAKKFVETAGPKNLILRSQIDGGIFTTEDFFLRVFRYDDQKTCTATDLGYAKLDKNSEYQVHLDPGNYEIWYSYFEAGILSNSSSEKIHSVLFRLRGSEKYEIEYLSDKTGSIFKSYVHRSGKRERYYNPDPSSICPKLTYLKPQ
jgi:hypothetical protein